jgi:hypothetical protein
LSPKKGELLFVFEAASISLLPVGKKVVPIFWGKGGIGEGKVNEVPELGSEIAFHKKVGDGF